MPSSPEWLETAQSPAHLVQFYGDDHRALARNVARFLCDGWKLGEGLLVVTTAQHRERLLPQLRRGEMDPRAAMRQGRLVLLDAEGVLARILVEGRPSAERFEEIIGGALGTLRSWTDTAGLRAFGEMVGLLWRDGLYPAAIELEELWERLLSTERIKLLCAYPVDVLGSEFEEGRVGPVLQAHTHFLPSIPDLEISLARPVNESATEILDRIRHYAREVSSRRRSSDSGLLKTGDAARALGTTARTLLFYEEEGLIRPRRTARGSRQYSRFDLARAAIAIRLSQMGFPLKLVKQLASVRPTARTGHEASAAHRAAPFAPAGGPGPHCRPSGAGRRDRAHTRSGMPMLSLSSPSHPGRLSRMPL